MQCLSFGIASCRFSFGIFRQLLKIFKNKTLKLKMVTKKRVVVTGMGLVSPIGSDLKDSFNNLIEGKSGIGVITKFDASSLPCQIAGEVKYGKRDDGRFEPDIYISPKEQKKMDEFIIFGMVAAIEAVEDSCWKPQDEYGQKRTGVLIGSGIGGLPAMEKSSLQTGGGARKISPFFIPSALINLTSGHVSIKYSFRGPNHSVVTACSTGAHAIGDAARLIMQGDADVMVAGSSEAAICKVGVAGFASAKALSTNYNSEPERASRPWDVNRDGFVMGEGAGVLVLEEYEHAKKRGAKIYAELVGYGLSGDAYHITAPHPEGRGAYDAMERAISNAGVSTADIGYINAHGTSTPLGDVIEFRAVERILGANVSNASMSSTKSSIGHLLGGAGSVEAIFAIQAMNSGVLPPTLNLTERDERCHNIDLIPKIAKEKKVNVVLSNSFGFGGTNVSLVFKSI